MFLADEFGAGTCRRRTYCRSAIKMRKAAARVSFLWLVSDKKANFKKLARQVCRPNYRRRFSYEKSRISIGLPANTCDFSLPELLASRANAAGAGVHVSGTPQQ